MSEENYMGEERREETHVHIDSLPGFTPKGGRRLQLELALIVTVLLAIFGVLLKNSVDIGKIHQAQESHEGTDNVRTEALAEGVSNLTEVDDRILRQLEGILVRQEGVLDRLDHIEKQVDRHIEVLND